MIILGIDPGLATLGYGILDKDKGGNVRPLDYGVVLTPKEENLPVRLAMLEEGIAKILDKFTPDEVAVEELFFSKNVTTGIAVAHARGVALLTCVKRCGRLFEYTPMQIKQALTGYGKADQAPDAAGDGVAVKVEKHSPSRTTPPTRSPSLCAIPIRRGCLRCSGSEEKNMIGYIKGKVIHSEAGVILLENNGVGYELVCSGAAFARLVTDGAGEAYTYLQVKEDGLTLFGFVSMEEKNMFLKLTTVSGVGPKMA